jgi:hypothetical protein
MRRFILQKLTFEAVDPAPGRTGNIKSSYEPIARQDRGTQRVLPPHDHNQPAFQPMLRQGHSNSTSTPRHAKVMEYTLNTPKRNKA